MFPVPIGNLNTIWISTTATDSSSSRNSTICLFTVTVSDEALILQAPTISCPADRTVPVSSDSGTVHLQWAIPTATFATVGIPTATKDGKDFDMSSMTGFIDDFTLFSLGFDYDYDGYFFGYDQDFNFTHGNVFTPGVYVITYTVENDLGTNACSFTYTITNASN